MIFKMRLKAVISERLFRSLGIIFKKFAKFKYLQIASVYDSQHLWILTAFFCLNDIVAKKWINFLYPFKCCKFIIKAFELLTCIFIKKFNLNNQFGKVMCIKIFGLCLFEFFGIIEPIKFIWRKKTWCKQCAHHCNQYDIKRYDQ